MFGCLSPLAASAQQPSQFGGLSPNFQTTPYTQNSPYGLNGYYNPGNQPLSPYLNMLRGGNPAVNYYYFVRPGLNQNSFGDPFLGSTGMDGRQSFFPQIDTLSDLDESGQHAGMRPTRTPVWIQQYARLFRSDGNGGGGGRNTNQSPLSTKSGMMSGK